MPIESDRPTESATAPMSEDAAARDAAALELGNNQARYIAMLAGALDCIISMDQHGNIVEFNAAAEQTFGYRSAQVAGRPLADVIIPPALRTRHHQGLAKRLATGQGSIVGQRIEIDAMRADGSEFPVELAIIQYELDGKPLFTGFLRDISARRQAEKYERFRSRILELLVGGEPLDTVLAALVRGVEQVCPSMLCSILLLHKDGKYFDKSIAPSLPAFFNAAIQGPTIGLGAGSCGTAAFTGERVIVEDIASHPYWTDYKELAARAGLAACWSQPIRSSSERILGTFAIYHRRPHMPTLADVAIIEQSAHLASIAIERKQTEATLRELNSTLETRVAMRTEQLAQARDAAEAASKAKSDFLANMSHEIRTPMNGVLGMVELLQSTALSPTQKHYANTIQSSGKTLLTVINDILDFSKVEAGKLTLAEQPFDLAELLEEVVMPYRLSSNAVVKLVASLAPETPVRLLGDAIRLQQVIANLLNNAFKFTDRGEVRLRVEALAVETQRLQLRCTISDTGIGIDAADRRRLFQPFSQIDNSSSRRFGGTGLGLVICQRLVQMMDGNIEVDSELGRGSTFRFQIWLRRDPAPRRAIDAITLQDKHLLAVDDDEDYLLILREQATALGMSVATVQQPSQALAAARATPPDIITIDLDMPNIDGFALDRELAAAAEVTAIPRILLTASCAPPGVHAIHQSGFDAAYSKPTSAQKLRTIFSVTLAGGRQQREPAANALHDYSSARVLVAEDNIVNRQVIDGMLRQFGVVADFAGDGEQALALIAQQTYDLIFMDCEMPVLDGYRASEKIRQLERSSSQTPAIIVALSAHALPEYRQRSLAAGMDEHLTKPLSLAVLEETLQHYLAAT